MSGKPQRGGVLIRLARSLVKRLLVPLVRLAIFCGWKRRFVCFYSSRIGHLVSEPDLFLKEGELGMREPFKGIWLASRDTIANRALLDRWRPFFKLIESPFLCTILMPLAKHPRTGVDPKPYIGYLDQTARYPQIQTAWGSRPPQLQLSEADRQRGRDELAALGAPRDCRFICIHSREAGFIPEEAHHSYRDAEIESYYPAMEELVRRGYWCIRVGDATMKPLPETEGVIDYALSPRKNEWMDVFLCAACEYFVGSSSGLALVAAVFGRRVAMANVLPIASVFPLGPDDIGIPKRLWSEEQQRHLTIVEMFASPSVSFRFSEEYERAGLRPVDNTPEEIRDLALELIGEAESPTPQITSRQDAFKKLMRPGLMGHGAAATVGHAFLEKHGDSLDRP